MIETFRVVSLRILAAALHFECSYPEPESFLFFVSSFFFSPWGGVLLHQTSILQHVGPLAAGACVTVLEMLPKVVGPVELLGGVALSELVLLLQVSNALFPVLVGGVSRLDTSVQ